MSEQTTDAVTVMLAEYGNANEAGKQDMFEEAAARMVEAEAKLAQLRAAVGRLEGERAALWDALTAARNLLEMPEDDESTLAYWVDERYELVGDDDPKRMWFLTTRIILQHRLRNMTQGLEALQAAALAADGEGTHGTPA
jgi:hypothetical protein